NLETHAGAFPSLDFKTNREIVPLTEDSSTLERLFQYVYPRRHPEIEPLEFDDLYKLAKAAEKYEVYCVMSICKNRMRYFTEMHPAQVLNYAFRHNYPDTFEAATSGLLDRPIDEAIEKVLPPLAIPWVRDIYMHDLHIDDVLFKVLYKNSCNRLLEKAIKSHQNCNRNRCYGIQRTTRLQLWEDLGDRRSHAAFAKFNETTSSGIFINSDCLDKIFAQMPKFDSFLKTSEF
ncbi:hypothetical protein H0H92_002877, partial [Tricholoma furcatifolium]